MRLRMNEARERRIESLKDALGENTKSGAIDRAAVFACEMLGDNTEFPNGLIEELLERADEQGSLTAAEIAEILDGQEVPVSYESSWQIDED